MELLLALLLLHQPAQTALSPRGEPWYFSTPEGREMLQLATVEQMVEQDADPCEALKLAQTELAMIDGAVAERATLIWSASKGAPREMEARLSAERLQHLVEGMAKAEGRLLYAQVMLCEQTDARTTPAP